MNYLRYLFYLFILIFASLNIITAESFSLMTMGYIYISVFFILCIEVLYKTNRLIAFYVFVLNRFIASILYFNDFIVTENIFQLNTQLNIYKVSTILYNANQLLTPALVFYFIYQFLFKNNVRFVHIIYIFVISILPSFLWNFESELLLRNILKTEMFITSMSCLLAFLYFFKVKEFGTKSREHHLLIILSVLFNTIILVKTAFELSDIRFTYIPNILSPINFVLFWLIITFSHSKRGEFIYNPLLKVLLILFSLTFTVIFRNDTFIFIQSAFVTGILIIEYIYNRFIIYKDHETQIKLNNGGRA